MPLKPPISLSEDWKDRSFAIVPVSYSPKWGLGTETKGKTNITYILLYKTYMNNILINIIEIISVLRFQDCTLLYHCQKAQFPKLLYWNCHWCQSS